MSEPQIIWTAHYAHNDDITNRVFKNSDIYGILHINIFLIYFYYIVGGYKQILRDLL